MNPLLPSILWLKPEGVVLGQTLDVVTAVQMCFQQSRCSVKGLLELSWLLSGVRVEGQRRLGFFFSVVSLRQAL